MIIDIACLVERCSVVCLLLYCADNAREVGSPSARRDSGCRTGNGLGTGSLMDIVMVRSQVMPLN